MTESAASLQLLAAPTSNDVAPRQISSSLSIVFGTAIMLMALAILGRPAVFPDTIQYMHNGGLFYRAVGRQLHLIHPSLPETIDFTMLAARAPWYGLLAWPLERIGTLWLLVAVQAMLAAWLIWLTWRTLAREAPIWTAYVVQAVTAVFSTLPLIVGFAMPDVFVSLLIIATTLLLVGWDRLCTLERVGLAVLTGFSSIVHGGNSLIALAMIVIALGVALQRKRRVAFSAPILTVICALAGGVVTVALMDVPITLIRGQPPGRPPFLSIRLLADGPGRTYLRAACVHSDRYLLCRHNNQPLDSDQDMLWSLDPNKSVFALSNDGERATLQREDLPFAAAVFLHDPIGVAASAARNWLLQLGMVATDAQLVDQRVYLGRKDLFPTIVPRTHEVQFDTWPFGYYRNSSLPGMIERAERCETQPDRCRIRLTIESARWLQGTEFGIACFVLLGLVIRAKRRRYGGSSPTADASWDNAIGFMAFAIAANALLCGALSGPFPRYQSAVSWLVVMMAAISSSRMVIRLRPLNNIDASFNSGALAETAWPTPRRQ